MPPPRVPAKVSVERKQGVDPPVNQGNVVNLQREIKAQVAVQVLVQTDQLTPVVLVWRLDAGA